MQRQTKLFEAPDGGLFSLKDITYPETIRKGEPFMVKGKVELFSLPFLAPIWVIAKVTAPETWYEHYISIWGSPTVGESQMAIGGDFEINFPKGFDREGEFVLEVEAHAGPTYTIDKITLPPFPPVASEETTFIVAGEVPPEEVGFRNFRILSYSKNGGEPVTPPGVLELDVGDRCRVNLGFDHMNGAVTGKFHAAIWQETFINPHDEILNAEKTFSVPSTPDWEPYEDSVDIIITSAISPGSEYGLYTKIMGITGGDIFTEYLANVITIVGAPPEEADIKDFDFKLTGGTYDIGTRVLFTASYAYKGIEQGGQLTISIGTGIYPTFNPVHTYSPLPVSFGAAADWETRGLEGNITLPDTLEAGETYSVRAKLETLVKRTQETDTDWSVFDITEVYKGTISKKQLEYNETTGTIPVSNVPYAKRSLVHVWGRNDTAKNQTLGIGWVVTAPDGSEVERHENDWASGWVGGGEDREFIGGRFDLDKAGTYNIAIALYMNSSDPVEIDSYNGRLCTVAEAPPPVPPTSDIRDFDFRVTEGTYAIGDRVSFSAPYDYKGMKQSGQLVLELGTGVYPTFSPVVKYSPMPVEFDEAMDWTSGRLTGTFPLTEALEPGRTYSVRAKLEALTDYAQETDTDWGVITIEAVAPPGEFTLTVRQSPAVGWITKSPDKAKYSYGEIVKVTSYMDTWAIGSYAFDYWDVDGEWLDTANPINFMVLASHTLTAHYRSI